MRLAYQRDPATIARWQRETYPAIVHRAKRDRADSSFWDESGFRADAVHGTTWGAKGQTPVVSVPSQRRGMSAAPAVSVKGAFWFATDAGGLTGERFVELLRWMRRGRRRPLHLILDGLLAHKTKAVTQYVVERHGTLPLHYLPGYAPDLNPDELGWSDANRTGAAQRPLQKGETLEARVIRQLTEICRKPALVRSFFQHPRVASISDFQLDSLSTKIDDVELPPFVVKVFRKGIHLRTRLFSLPFLTGTDRSLPLSLN